MKIHIGFSKPRCFKIGAELIRFWMKSLYSHVYVRFEYATSKSVIFHAAHGMVHFKSPINFLKENIIVKEYTFEVDSSEHDLIFDECMELAGEKYSVLTLVKIFISDVVFNLFGKVINLGDSRGYICSELVGKICSDKLGINFTKPNFLLKPDDIDKGLKSGTI